MEVYKKSDDQVIGPSNEVGIATECVPERRTRDSHSSASALDWCSQIGPEPGGRLSDFHKCNEFSKPRIPPFGLPKTNQDIRKPRANAAGLPRIPPLRGRLFCLRSPFPLWRPFTDSGQNSPLSASERQPVLDSASKDDIAIALPQPSLASREAVVRSLAVHALLDHPYQPLPIKLLRLQRAAAWRQSDTRESPCG